MHQWIYSLLARSTRPPPLVEMTKQRSWVFSLNISTTSPQLMSCHSSVYVYDCCCLKPNIVIDEEWWLFRHIGTLHLFVTTSNFISNPLKSMRVEWKQCSYSRHWFGTGSPKEIIFYTLFERIAYIFTAKLCWKWLLSHATYSIFVLKPYCQCPSLFVTEISLPGHPNSIPQHTLLRSNILSNSVEEAQSYYTYKCEWDAFFRILNLLRSNAVIRILYTTSTDITEKYILSWWNYF